MARCNLATYGHLLLASCTSLAICAAFVLAGCGGHGESEVLISQGRNGVVPEGQAPVGFELPPPSALAGDSGELRRASYVEEDLISHGGEYNPALPHDNVSTVGMSAQFDSSWDPVAAGMSGLGYCIYDFTIPGYDRAPEIYWGWEDDPEDLATAWMGLGNWDRDAWDWFPCTAEGVADVGNLASYISGSDRLVLAVVLANAEVSALRYVRLGPHPLEAAIRAVPTTGLAPLDVKLDTAGSVIVGSVVQHEWDYDNDGSYDADTGAVDESSHVYENAGEYQAGLRVTDAYGIQDTATTSITAYDSWTHTWGNQSNQHTEALDTDNTAFIYQVGLTYTTAFNRDCLMLKHGLDGELQWVAAWGGEGHEGLADLQWCEAGIFTAGYSESYGAGNQDILTQRWDTDGNVVWSRVWGTAENDTGTGVAVSDTAVYVVGFTWLNPDKDIVLLKYDFDGNLIWQRTWDGGSHDDAQDIVASKRLFAPDYTMYITGSTMSPNPSFQDVLYLQLTADGELTQQSTWRSDSHPDQAGNAIYVRQSLLQKDVFIAGYVGSSGYHNSLLLETGSGTGAMSWSWDIGSENNAYGILATADSFIIAGGVSGYEGKQGGIIADISPTGSIQNSTIWTDTGVVTGFYDMTSFPGSGLLVVGYGKAADSGSWSGTVGTISSPGGTWSSFSGTLATPTGATGSPTAAAVKITDGVVDSGGGQGDSIVAAVQI